MDEWMDGRTDGWKDGWMNGWMDGWKDGWMDEWMDGLMITCYERVFVRKWKGMRIDWTRKLEFLNNLNKKN